MESADVVSGLDMVQEVLKREINAAPRVVSGHWPSSASKIVPCEKCGGDGCRVCGTTGRRVVGKCMRQLFWRHLLAPKTNFDDPSGKMRMKGGDAIHDMMYGLAAKGGLVAPEVPLRVDIGLSLPESGRLDGVLLDGKTGKVVHSELKTSFGWTTDTMKSTREIKEEWILQTVEYRWLWGILYPAVDVLKTVYLYVDRGTFWATEIDRDWSWEEIEESHGSVAARWKELEGWVAAAKDLRVEYLRSLGEEELVGMVMDPATATWPMEVQQVGKYLPPPDHMCRTKEDFGAWQCQYCDYRTRCMTVERERKKAAKAKKAAGRIDE